VDAIYRYPVKGMTPERLPQVSLRPHQTLPNDRAYAIENGTRDFDDATPRYFPKIKYLMLMKNEKLATLHSHFDDASHTLTISRDGQEMVKGTLTSAAGRGAIEEFLTTYMERDLRGPPRIVHAEGFSFSDVARKVVSILNLASLRALEEALGRPLDPLRFRANIHLEGLQPWEEFDWVGREFSLGEAGLKGVSRIVRCAAVNVDPKTAARDTEIPAFLFKTYGHADFGIYADVRTGGVVREQNQFS
jgi:hypothetical protein